MADADVKRRTHRAEVHWQTVSRMEHVSRFNHLVKEWGRGGRGTFWEQVWLAPVSHREANWSRQCHRQERPVTMVVAERKKWPIPSYSHHTDHHFSTFLRHSWDVLACRVVCCHLKELSPRVFRFAFASEFLNLGNPGGVQPILVACCWLSCLSSRSHLAQGTQGRTLLQQSYVDPQSHKIAGDRMWYPQRIVMVRSIVCIAFRILHEMRKKIGPSGPPHCPRAKRVLTLLTK